MANTLHLEDDSAYAPLTWEQGSLLKEDGNALDFHTLSLYVLTSQEEDALLLRTHSNLDFHE